MVAYLMMKKILKPGLIISAILFAFWCMFYNWDDITEKLLTTKTMPSTDQPLLTKEENIQRDISIMSTNSSEIPIVPVHPGDVNVNFPKYNLEEDVVNTDWFKAASYFDYDLTKRPVEYKCDNVQMKGNWRICQDERYFVKSPCLVYSFGINRDFSFDDAMARLGCEVHSFDPSMGIPDYIRNNSVHFHAIGLGGKNIEDFEARRDIYVKKKQLWTLMTLGTIMAALGHKDRILDVLKIDIETHEWAVIEYLVNSPVIGRVKQFCLEYHLFEKWPPKPEYPKFLRLYKKLHDSGFAKFYTGIHGGKNFRPKTFNLQVDIGYVNTAK